MREGDVEACRSSLSIDRWAGRLRCGGSIASFGQPWLEFRRTPDMVGRTCAYYASDQNPTYSPVEENDLVSALDVFLDQRPHSR